MKTEKQLSAEFHTTVQAIIPTYWLSKPKNITGMFATWQILDSIGVYTFDTDRSAEERTFQLDIYADPDSLETLEEKMDLIKTALEAINYRLQGSQADFLDAELDKVVRVSRWERFNA